MIHITLLGFIGIGLFLLYRHSRPLLLHLGQPAFHVADCQQQRGVLGLHRQHFALGVERGDLLLVAFNLLGQLLRREASEAEAVGCWFQPDLVWIVAVELLRGEGSAPAAPGRCWW